MARPIGERVAVLETKLPLIEKSLETLSGFSDELKLVRRQVDRILKMGRPTLWLISAALLHATGGSIGNLLAHLSKLLAAAL